ncbi:hypothetical protein THRCLA_01395 [Thraustotheca clavata]|uniref:Transmembrane protein n=1 Tax=Thraustotheca clavata TaxID=74557 RepID=A0A1W0A8E1_9STRA|nr:hypothetical protein THRCLA_01395 [Thraustotheca clavata]
MERVLADAWSSKSSLFRVGDNVPESTVLTYMAICVGSVILFEYTWHYVGHRLEPYPKYHEMMQKITSELMILGLLGLLIHLASEAYWLNYYAKGTKAFKIADQTIFFVAVALILQALVIFGVLRYKNIDMDKIELASSKYVYQRAKRVFAAPTKMNFLQRYRANSLMRIKIMRRYFLNTFKLPQIFEFSWYVRVQQDAQITHLIDVEFSQWILLLLVWLLFVTVHLAVEKIPAIHNDDEVPYYVRIYVFMGFEWALTIAMGCLLLYLKFCLNKALNQIGGRNKSDLFQTMKAVAHQEHHLDESKEESAKQLQEVLQSMEAHHHPHKFFFASDSGVQLVKKTFKHFFSKEESDPHHYVSPLKLPWFSGDLLHFVLKTLLMINGLYVAIMINSIVFLLPDLPDLDKSTALFVLAMPIAVNATVLAPLLMQKFVLVSTLHQLNPECMTTMLSKYLSTIAKKTTMVQAIQQSLKDQKKTVDDFAAELQAEAISPTSSYIYMDTLRKIFILYNFHVSVFKFNSMIRLFFKTKGTTVNFKQLLELLRGEVDVQTDQTVDAPIEDTLNMFDENDKNIEPHDTYALEKGDFTLAPLQRGEPQEEALHTTPKTESEIIGTVYCRQE